MKLVGIADTCKKEPKLSRQAIARIEKARQRIAGGEFVAEDAARKEVG